MTRKSYPGGAAPYSAALISLSVPSTPTRRILTSTPRPWGTSSSRGLGTSRKWMLFGLPGMTQMAFTNGLLQRLACSCGSVEAATALKRSIVASPSRGKVGGATLFAGNGRRDAGMALAARPDRVVTQRPLQRANLAGTAPATQSNSQALIQEPGRAPPAYSPLCSMSLATSAVQPV